MCKWNYLQIRRSESGHFKVRIRSNPGHILTLFTIQNLLFFHKNSKQWVFTMWKIRRSVPQLRRSLFRTIFASHRDQNFKSFIPLFLKIFQFFKFKVDFEAPKVIPSPITMMVNSWVVPISPVGGGAEWWNELNWHFRALLRHSNLVYIILAQFRKKRNIEHVLEYYDDKNWNHCDTWTGIPTVWWKNYNARKNKISKSSIVW